MSKLLIALISVALAGVPLAFGQDIPNTPPWRLLRAVEAEQVRAVNSALDRGLPPDNDIGLLMLDKGSLVLPLIEKKIEQVLKSPSPRECFIDKMVDPNRFVSVAASGIANTGSEHALTELAKLIRLDEERFGRFVEITLNNSKDYSKSHNPFVVAYHGLAIGDPAVDWRILTWAESNLSVDPQERARAEAAARGFGPPPPSPSETMKHLWAEALLDRYGDVPTEAQWVSDPIASRLSAHLAESLHREVPRFAREALEQRAPKL
jgi:hypothetical protein